MNFPMSHWPKAWWKPFKNGKKTTAAPKKNYSLSYERSGYSSVSTIPTRFGFFNTIAKNDVPKNRQYTHEYILQILTYWELKNKETTGRGRLAISSQSICVLKFWIRTAIPFLYHGVLFWCCWLGKLKRETNFGYWFSPSFLCQIQA